MKIQTKFQGEVEVTKEQVFTFKKPLLGFEGEEQFAILPALDEVSPFLMMQSVQTPGLAFYLISPWVVEETYEFDLTDEQIELLQVSKPEDVNVFALVTVTSDIELMTANLLAPIVINGVTQQAMQIVLQQTSYTTKHRILKVED